VVGLSWKWVTERSIIAFILMEERKAKAVYQELEQQFASKNPNDVQNLANRMGTLYQSMGEAIERYEAKRTATLEQFKYHLQSIMESYVEGPFQQQVRDIQEGRAEAEERWNQIVPQMDALTQIKNIYRQSFTLHPKGTH
jgi:replicative DNA helicase